VHGPPARTHEYAKEFHYEVAIIFCTPQHDSVLVSAVSTWPLQYLEQVIQLLVADTKAMILFYSF